MSDVKTLEMCQRLIQTVILQHAGRTEEVEEWQT